MNKQELLDYLLAKPNILSLGKANVTEEIYGYKKYIVTAVISTKPGAMTMQNIGFYENVETSKCLFMNSEPFVEVEESFTDKVNAKIQQAIDSGAIKGAFLTAVSTAHKRMILTIVKPNDIKAEILAFEKPNGSIDYIEIS